MNKDEILKRLNRFSDELFDLNGEITDMILEIEEDLK